MEEAKFYLTQGVNHITDIKGFDHMLFIVALCAGFRLEHWRRVVVLITAFTVGHSISLALTSLNIINVSPSLVEVLIPCTILITCLFNLISKGFSKLYLQYTLALMFGLIHGMGFSSFFKSMMMGISSNIILPLMWFNLGIEAGQLMILSVFMVCLWLVTGIMKASHREWTLVLSGAGAALAIEMIFRGIS